jgi:chorismate synthase
MKIETDRVEIVSGVRHSQTIGSPIAIIIRNRDWENWTAALPVEDVDGADENRKPVTRPRPGHADLAGAIKYDFRDARYILGAERPRFPRRGGRRGTGSLPWQFGIEVLSHVIAVGGARLPRPAAWERWWPWAAG